MGIKKEKNYREFYNFIRKASQCQNGVILNTNSIEFQKKKDNCGPPGSWKCYSNPGKYSEHVERD